jgi:signal transduction histidine kinase
MAAAGVNFEIFVVFFIYGLAFFSMGLVLLLELRRSPLLPQSRAMHSLVFFGLVHGIHEWLEIFLLLRGWLALSTPQVFFEARLALLIVSFASLFYYGLQVVSPRNSLMPAHLISICLVFLAIYSTLLIASSTSQQHGFGDWMQHADALARYIIAVPSAFMAALALFRQSHQARDETRLALSTSLRIASLGFALYGLSQIIVPPVDFFPGNILNSSLFNQWMGIPVQAIRAAMAVLITVGLIRATQLVETERQKTFVTAQLERVQALEQVQRDLVEREALRRELLRHTVIAQEDERARIARELHDETSQFLTALSLDLATLKQQLPRKPEAIVLLDRLQRLSRLMSEGIYRMVRDLRPAQLDDLGLAAALLQLVEVARAQDVDVKLRIEGPRQRLDPLVETVCFRVAQESIMNIIRHSGCSQAKILLQFTPGRVSLQVMDEGVGFDVHRLQIPPRGWGLEGMRERAESVGGTIHIDSQPGSGVRVQLTIPVQNDSPQNVQESRYENDPHHVGG